MSDFTSFRVEFKGDLVTPDDAGYAEALYRWAVNARRNAQMVAFAKNAEDVSLAIKYAKEHKLPIAIRGGGHSPSGASSIEGGLVIDLSRYLNTVKVDAEKKLAYAGGGAIWETVDKTAIEHGLATVGGTINHVCSLLYGCCDVLTIMHRPVLEGMCRVFPSFPISSCPQASSWWGIWMAQQRSWPCHR